jgi:hypothetical protein
LARQSALIDLGFNEIYLAHDFGAVKPCCPSRRPGLGIPDVDVGDHLILPFAAELRA